MDNECHFLLCVASVERTLRFVFLFFRFFFFLLHPHNQLPCWSLSSFKTECKRTVCSAPISLEELGGCRWLCSPAPSRNTVPLMHSLWVLTPPLSGAERNQRLQGGWGQGRAERAGDPPPPLPLRLPRRLTVPGHPPHPMSVSQGGPWNRLYRLLRVLARLWESRVEPGLAECGAGARAIADPRHTSSAPRITPPCSSWDRAELQPHSSPGTSSPPPPSQHPWGPGDFKGVWGSGSRETTGMEKWISLSLEMGFVWGIFLVFVFVFMPPTYSCPIV